MPVLSISEFRGGLNLTAPTTLEDNQFETLTNMYYNDSKRVQTRRGITTFGQPVPDSVTLINACEATTNFSVSDDGANLTTGTAIRGAASLSFDITVATSANNDAILSNSSLSADISSAKGYLAFWIKPPTGFNTNLTNVQVRLGSSSSNYYEWTLSTLTENTNNFVVLLYSAATTTGTVTDTAITYFRLIVNYTASYTNQTGILLDSIYSYAATSTKPIASYFFFERDDTLVTTALCTSGTNMFKYDETSTYWEVINTGLTEFETATGYTTYRTRWAFCVYKNFVYMCNGIDNYRRWNGTTILEYSTMPKVRYLRYMGDRVFGAGEDSNPSTLYYTAAAPSDASTINTNSVVVGGDEQGRINILRDLGNIIMAAKDKKIYAVDVTGTSVSAIDAGNGGYADRAAANVDNALLLFNDTGIDYLRERSGVSGAAAVASEPYTADVSPLITQIAAKQYNSGCGYYISPIHNYYFSFDTNNDNIPDTTLVYSALIGKVWSLYNLGSIYQFGEYKDSSAVVHYLIAPGTSGQMYEIETGFSDSSIAIDHELKTKNWDFDAPQTWKDFYSVDIFGLASESASISVEVLVDSASASTATIDSTVIDTTATTTPIGTSIIGVTTTGGGGSSTSTGQLDLYPYKIRIPVYGGGQTVQVRMYSSTAETAWTLDRMSIAYDSNTFDVFPTANIA